MTFQIENVDWQSGKDRLAQLREQVFVFEWQLPRDAEFDKNDFDAAHVLVYNEQLTPIATGRLTKGGEIGRIAVRREYRNSDVYQSLFGALLNIAKQQKLKTVRVNCELQSVAYHQSLGFKPSGPAFMEAGIPRQRMACPLKRFAQPDVTQMH
ncbi:GNAT family N-acetyltransferase [Alteromonas sp. ASW11-130]|uniref:GNAT family N-acetyltransferase n=1 Tax=Alteromonas sp. ASW11-130 TaxID=3015775 RepID=UPI002242BD72|nr:GNAT family N-acetyltransferase [Alteromonas sp. ASW11-130]MCW8090213.1 GNAT family N-acetyltransferase [Alteromonas sp. ASW11-130]